MACCNTQVEVSIGADVVIFHCPSIGLGEGRSTIVELRVDLLHGRF